MDNAAPPTAASVTGLLRLTYGVVPVVAGLDKFTNLLTHWSHYLNPALARLLPLGAETFMRLVGVIEIVAGLIVLAKPRLGAAIVALWLTLIALTLLAGWRYADVAVRDLVMAVGALTLARLSPR
ncbi:MAG TPA: tRNA (5-methylaminomethyl-2-thiouridylate)-methyltransferase [Opitutaceae bacterium]|nr:tRNA (5-methylaminomethyl-2-thiouridylate)-methyltransferase [Opitutaceae bacterium]